MMELSNEEKLKLLQALKDKAVGGQIDNASGLPMEAVPAEEMTPEKAAQLEALKNARNPASSDMVAVPMDVYAPKGAFQSKEGKPGENVSSDVTGQEVAPELDSAAKDERLAKLKALLQSR